MFVDSDQTTSSPEQIEVAMESQEAHSSTLGVSEVVQNGGSGESLLQATNVYSGQHRHSTSPLHVPMLAFPTTPLGASAPGIPFTPIGSAYNRLGVDNELNTP